MHAWAPPAPCMHGLAHHTAAVEQAAVVAWQESQLLAEATQGARDGGAVHAQLARDLPLTGAVLKVHAHDGLVDAWPESHGSGEGGNHIARTASQQAATGGAVPSAAGTLGQSEAKLGFANSENPENHVFEQCGTGQSVDGNTNNIIISFRKAYSDFLKISDDDKDKLINLIGSNNSSPKGGGKMRRSRTTAAKKPSGRACWKATAQKVRCRDGVVRTLYANASKPGDWRVKRVRQLPRGKQEVRYVKPVV